MYAAIAVGTFLLGGWVLEPPDDEQQAVTKPVQPPSVSAPALASPSVPLDRSRLRTTVSSEAPDRTRDRGILEGQTPSSQSSRNQRQGAGQLPFLPTESLPPEAEAAQGQPMEPTAPLNGAGGRNAGGLSTATGPLFGPMSPTGRADRSQSPWQPGYRSSSSSGSQPNSHLQPLGGMGVAVPPVPQKAFSGYQAGGGVSPYMNIFRRDSGGTVDNYSTLVKPALDQRVTNQQFNRDITGLNRSALMQNSMLQQLNSDNRALQGVSTPQFYMNYGSYYP